MSVFANADELLARLHLIRAASRVTNEMEVTSGVTARDYLNRDLRERNLGSQYRRISLAQMDALRGRADMIDTMVRMHENALIAVCHHMALSLMELSRAIEPETDEAVELGVPSFDPDTGVMAPFHKRTYEGGELEAPFLPKLLAGIDDGGWE